MTDTDASQVCTQLLNETGDNIKVVASHVDVCMPKVFDVFLQIENMSTHVVS
mgnify:CR=1 FL=1